MSRLPYPRESRALDFASRLCEAGRFGFRQSCLGIAVDRTERATHAIRASKACVEQWYAVDAAICDARVARQRINPTERERLEGRLGTRLTYWFGQPFGRCVVRRRCRSVVPLRIVSRNDVREPPFQHIRRRRLISCKRDVANSDRSGRAAKH